MSFLPALLVSVFAGFLLVAALWDATSLTIPNRLNAGLALLFVPAALVAGLSPLETAACVGFAFAILAVGAGLFAFNLIGGGDVKLLAAAALWLGPQAGLEFLAWTAVSGGVLAVFLITLRKTGGAMLEPIAPRWAAPVLADNGQIPYGVAIATGGLIAWPAGALATAGLG